MDAASALDGYRDGLNRQTREVEELVSGLSDDQLEWRPEPEKWSVGEHVVHLARTNRPYLEAIRETLAEARDRGLTGRGPFRKPWLAEWVVKAMEPPPRLKVPTMKELVPEPGLPIDRVLEVWRESQSALLASVDDAEGLDLGRARMRSPFLPLLKLTADQAYRAVLAHNRRHIWHARRTMEAEGFPGR